MPTHILTVKSPVNMRQAGPSRLCDQSTHQGHQGEHLQYITGLPLVLLQFPFIYESQLYLPSLYHFCCLIMTSKLSSPGSSQPSFHSSKHEPNPSSNPHTHPPPTVYLSAVLICPACLPSKPTHKACPHSSRHVHGWQRENCPDGTQLERKRRRMPSSTSLTPQHFIIHSISADTHPASSTSLHAHPPSSLHEALVLDPAGAITLPPNSSYHSTPTTSRDLKHDLLCVGGLFT
jgi:hypothetical protein